MKRHQIIAASIGLITALAMLHWFMKSQAEGLNDPTTAPAAPARTNAPPKTGCIYKTREWANDKWACPSGWTDTGSNWEYGAHGEKQCENCTPGMTLPTNAPPKTGCEYKTREWATDKWACGSGWTDTGAMWEYGANGEKQCEKCG